ncbi:MAG TPA: hypothetical protein VK920_10180 [Solirubrobacterales bacterium]|nr:hypothetical protein [Solirubrobacterales bacterium]
MSAARPQITARELLLVALGAVALSVVMNWPLILNLGDDIPKDLGDPLVQAWQVAWGGHALANQPLEFFQSNQFWPLDDTLAFSDALLGYAPAGLIGSGPEAAVVRYDLLFLFAYALAFGGAYLLARELGAGPAGAVVAGAAFAFAPFRLEQDGHMHVISSGGGPLALALGVRGYRLRRPWVVVAAFAVATWQLSLGFTLGLPLAYLLGATGLVAAAVWLRRGRPVLDRRLVVATIAGVVLFGGCAAVISRPYLRVADEHPEATRGPAEVASYSGPVYAFLVAPDENPIWGGATASLRDDLEHFPEKTLFPGLVIVALAIAGLWSSTYPRRTRIVLAAAVAAISVLALGFKEEGGLLWPYRVVYETLPGWEGIRTPGRLMTFSSLGLALLAAAGAELAMRAARSRTAARAAPVAVATVLAAAIVVEGRGLPFDPFDDLAQPSPPDPPVDVAGIPAPQLNLPAERPHDNRRYLLWSTNGFPDMVNGRSSTNPAFTAEVIARARSFPDRRSAAYLRRLGIRTVLVHPRRTRRPVWDDGGRPPPLPGIGVTRRREGDVIVYEIRSPSGASRNVR